MNRPLQRRLAHLSQAQLAIAQEQDRLRADGIDPGSIYPNGGEPLDAETCLKLGKLICFLKGDWQRGLPLLARGSDERLRELAHQDLLPTMETAARVRRG